MNVTFSWGVEGENEKGGRKKKGEENMIFHWVVGGQKGGESK